MDFVEQQEQARHKTKRFNLLFRPRHRVDDGRDLSSGRGGPAATRRFCRNGLQNSL
jgi:hypothetical protein